ncbi:hypothetical protein GWI33_018153 [Rhynchophorus ferrugineus]|uniref:Uncharacterized protein n=1 Tax=Rhynchophorus ferrugineus TaxID=354439 RepID=A0A834HYH1_RHYFE|nr:hypothetical protein GWI33_018153 [Rhynchophorus ferrugineus]
MEAVKSFNSELSSLYEVKPPISKAKMTAITRGAIKAIKFYKHVVQSVEKFILKCKPEYKVPGLYVIDSIVRQSRHQFGAEKDVFAPRFAKNLQQTFINLFKCPPEDKSKIIRVLNLWQKNQVFQADVIQPLFDMADPNNPIHQQIQQDLPIQQSNGGSGVQSAIKGSPALQRTPTKANQATDGVASSSNLTEPVLHQLQQLQRLLKKSADAGRPEQVHFNKKLLDFDYGDDEDEVNPSPRPIQQGLDSVANLLTNPEVLRQLQTLQSTIASAVPGSQLDIDAEKLKKLQEMKLQEDEFDKHLAQTVPNLPFASECEFKPNTQPTMIGGLQFIPPAGDNSQMSQAYDMSISQHDNSGGFGGSQNSGTGNDVEVITLDPDDSHSPSEDRYSKRRRSRSRSRDRRDKDRDRRRRSRSRSRGRRHRSRSRDRDRKDKDRKDREKESERDRERKKRGLPAVKKENLSVCSTTLWVGHLSKLVHQDDLSNTFGEFGDIVSIDLIPPRGCAFIVMHRRQDAARCLNKLKNHMLHGKAITLAWAPGKGVKGKDLKDYWESDLGVSYIPWNKIKLDIDLEMLEDGGMIDEETMPPWMQMKIEETNKKKNLLTDKSSYMMGGVDIGKVPTPTIDTSQPPPMPGTNLLQPQLLPLVNPFQYNNRLLGIMPNMANMANLPIGVPPPNIASSMMPNLGLGLNSPFQGPPGYVPPQLSGMENKPTPPPSTDANLRSLGESLMNLAGQSLTMPPLTMPPITQPPPPHNIEDNMDIEMEDAGHHESKQSMALNDPLQASSFGGRRDDGSNKRDTRDARRDDRGRRRSRSRDRDQNRDRDSHSSGRDRDRRDRDRDFGRNRDRNDRDRDRDSRDRRGNDRERRWGGTDRRDGADRRDGLHDRRDGFYDRRDDQRDREKTLNDRLKEMAGMKFEEPPSNSKDRKLSEGTRGGSKEDSVPSGKEENIDGTDEKKSNPNEKNGDTVGFTFESPPPHDLIQDGPGYRGPPLMGDAEPYGPPMSERPPFDNPPPFGPYGPEGPSYMDQGPPFADGGYGPYDMDSYGPGYGPEFGPGFDGPRSKRGGRRGRRGRGRDGPDFFPGRDEFGPPMMRGGPEFAPRGPPPLRGRGFFGPRGLRGRGGMPFREGPPGVFNPGFDGPPEFFRGPRGGVRPPFDDAFHRGRVGRFRGRGGRGPEGFEGALPFGDGPPGLELSEIQEDVTPPIKPERTRSRWGNADEHEDPAQEGHVEEEKIEEPVNEGGDGAGTPLRDEAVEEQPTIIEDGPPGVDENSIIETAVQFEEKSEKELPPEPTESGQQDSDQTTEETITENEDIRGLCN